MSNQFEISHASYGKSDFGVMSWTQGESSSVRDLSLRVTVEGAFTDSFRTGDNHAVLPSETLRRHAVAECAARPEASPEDLAEAIAARLLDLNPAIDALTVTGRATSWRAIGAHTFTPLPGERHFTLQRNRAGERARSGGLTGVVILLTAGSSFTGFLRDELTAQTDSTDRPVLGSVAADWTYLDTSPAAPDDFDAQLAATLADRRSNSIQQWITDAAALLLDANAGLASLRLSFTSSTLTEAGPGSYARADAAAGVTSVELRRSP